MAYFKSMLRSQIPQYDTSSGNVFLATDTREVFISVPSPSGNSLIPLTSLFSTEQSVGVGPQGPTGLTGAPGQGLTWRDVWQAGDSYAPYDVVFFNGSAYICTVQTYPGDVPTGVKFNLLASKGDTGPAGLPGPVDIGTF